MGSKYDTRVGVVLWGVLEEVKIVCSGINGKQQIVGSDLTQENLKGISFKILNIQPIFYES